MRSKASSQNRRYVARKSAACFSGSPRRRDGRSCALRPRSISPARSSTARCFDTACTLIGNGSASSFTVASPSASRSRIARRVGSARAAKVALSSSTAICSPSRLNKLLVEYASGQPDERSEMGRIVVTEFVSVDGVMEDPGGAEDFKYGGWTFEIGMGDDGAKFKFDETRASEALLLGRV